jgi:hypothetical protein
MTYEYLTVIGLRWPLLLQWLAVNAGKFSHSACNTTTTLCFGSAKTSVKTLYCLGGNNLGILLPPLPPLPASERSVKKKNPHVVALHPRHSYLGLVLVKE